MKPLLTLCLCALLLCGCETVPVPVKPTAQSQHKPVTGTIKLIPADNKLIDGFIGPVSIMLPQDAQVTTIRTRSMVQQPQPVKLLTVLWTNQLPDSNQRWLVYGTDDLTKPSIEIACVATNQYQTLCTNSQLFVNGLDAVVIVSNDLWLATH